MATFIIAEIAQAHDGSLGIAHSYIDALHKCGVDAVKFQTHIAEAESSEFEAFRIPFSYKDKNRYDYWKRMEFNAEEWGGLKDHCGQKGLEFISSPFSIAAVELLEKLQVKKYKIGSGEINNYLMLDKIAKTSKPIILSSGMSDWKELDETVNFLKGYHNHLSILQCTTAYPTKPTQWGISLIQEMKERYQLPIGYSDHSSSIYSSLAAVALGAEIIEFHAVFNHQLFGPDTKASLDMDQIKSLVEGIRAIEISMGSKYVLKDQNTPFEELKILFGKSLAINKKMELGSIITLEDLESKKPGDKGIAAKYFKDVLGKTLATDKHQWDFLNWDDLKK